MIVEWRPIETAPLDGTKILLIENGLVVPGYFVEDERGWWEYNSHPCEYVDHRIESPSAWMPFPPATLTPSEEQQP